MKIVVLFASILRIILIAAIISITIVANAQSVAVNTTGNVADASAMLDISSTSKGFLAPRMTTAQRTGIPTPANGLMVYDTDMKTYWYYSDVWKEVNNAGGGGGFALPYSGSYSDPSKLFSITNTSITAGSAAIHGKIGTGIPGLPSLPVSVAIWGDNSKGPGILGTSDTGVGVYAVSMLNHGVSGYTESEMFAGIHGSHGNNGAGVLGTGNIGLGIKGTSESNHGVYGSTNGVTVAGVYGTNNSGNVLGAAVKGKITNSGTAIYGENTGGNGQAGKFEVNNTQNSSEAVLIKTNGLGSGLNTVVNNANNTADAVFVGNHGMAAAIRASNYNHSNLSAAINGFSDGLKGIEGAANGTGVYGRSTGSSEGIGVQGQALSSDINGIGVKGISHSTVLTRGAVTGINHSNGVAVYGESTAGGVAIYGKTTKVNGAAIFGVNNATDGQAIYGTATGEDGVAIYGEAGIAGSKSRAAYFRNSNSVNSKDIVQIDNLGTGKFLSMQDGFGDEKTTIAKNGDIKTDGTVTVKNNKGIIRNSGDKQLRYETPQAVLEGPGGSEVTLGTNEWIDLTVYFSTPFSAPPIVAIGNVSSGSNLISLWLTIQIRGVTANSCVLRLWNLHSQNSYKATWNLIAIGPE